MRGVGCGVWARPATAEPEGPGRLRVWHAGEALASKSHTHLQTRSTQTKDGSCDC